MTTAVITVVRGRHDHLRLQSAALERSTVQPDLRIVVAIDDQDVDDVLAATSSPHRVVHVPRVLGGLPLARARNVGASAAIVEGATVLVFLDVDCLPGPGLVEAYEAAATHPTTCRDLLCGPVAYLPPAPPGGYELTGLESMARPQPARPAPEPGTVERTWTGYELFWSLSFALTTSTWADVGGFDESYVGYGGEDTDFACRAERAGTPLTWVGGARAFHQHHPVSSPPVEHLDDIVRNAAIFHERWGWWPMRGWLDAFEERGLVRRRPDGSYEASAVPDASNGIASGTPGARVGRQKTGLPPVTPSTVPDT